MLLYAAPFSKQNSAKIFSRQTFLHKHSRDRFSTIYFQYFELKNYHMCTPAVEDGSAESDSFADKVGELGLFAIVRILGQRFFLLWEMKNTFLLNSCGRNRWCGVQFVSGCCLEKLAILFCGQILLDQKTTAMEIILRYESYYWSHFLDVLETFLWRARYYKSDKNKIFDKAGSSS